MSAQAPLVGLIMGSQSDWPTLKAAAEILMALGVAHETRIVSAHRTPKRLYEYAQGAAARGLKVVIAGAGGAAHLPGMTASMTTLPVLGVPIELRALKGLDSLLSIVQMPGGVPVATFAIGEAGAKNAALHAAAILALGDAKLAKRLAKWRAKQTGSVAETAGVMNPELSLSAPVAPGGTIGILGGGQLGRMLALAAARLGLKAFIYSDDADAPAFQVAAQHRVGRYDDEAALAAFASACDAVTFEFENVPGATAAFLAVHVPVNPNPRALAIAQDRWEEKNFVAKLGLQTPAFASVSSHEDAKAAFTKIGAPAVLKTRRLGYDGKGQAKVFSAEDTAHALDRFKCAPCILEAFVDFAFEASVVAARGADGSFAAYDPPENIHEHHILRRSTVPSRLSQAQSEDAQAIARRIADAFDYVGVLAVELFVARDGALLINEIAPRVHNSGHWTLEACAVSQFEQHIRAVAGWPLGDASRHSDAVMENIIGEEASDWEALAARGGALHLYGKTEPRPGRKMGHITWVKEKD